MDLFELIRLQRIDPTTKYVLIVIASFGDGKTLSNCFPSIPSVAERACLSESTVKRALNDATANHGLQIAPGDRITSNRYDFSGVRGRKDVAAKRKAHNKGKRMSDEQKLKLRTAYEGRAKLALGRATMAVPQSSVGTANLALGTANLALGTARMTLGYGQDDPRVRPQWPSIFLVPSHEPTQNPTQGPSESATDAKTPDVVSNRNHQEDPETQQCKSYSRDESDTGYKLSAPEFTKAWCTKEDFHQDFGPIYEWDPDDYFTTSGMYIRAVNGHPAVSISSNPSDFFKHFSKHFAPHPDLMDIYKSSRH